MSKVRPLSKELQEKAIKELNEDVARIPDDIEAIKNWLKMNKDITARTDDQFILTFLRGCKFSLERTKDKLERYYTLRSDFLKNRDPFAPEIQEILKLGIFLPLINQKDRTAPRMIIMQGAIYDPSKIKMKNIFKVNMMMMDIMLDEDDQTVICGMQMMKDWKGVTMDHIATPAMAKKMLTYFQEALPIRPKGMHMLNNPSFFDTIYAIMTPFMNVKMKSRMQQHDTNNLEEFYTSMPKEELPKEYGGNGSSIQELTDYWKKKVESYAKWFKKDEKYGVRNRYRFVQFLSCVLPKNSSA